MKRYISLAIIASVGILSTPAKDVSGVQINKVNGETLQLANTSITALTFQGDNAVFTATDGTKLSIPRTEITSISNIHEVADAYTVNYNGTTAAVVNPYAFQGVTTDIDGAYVTTTNTNIAEELTFTLSGSTTDGSYLYNGAYKCKIQLNGVDITSRRGAAIDVQCGKRIAVVLVEGTESNLTDCSGGTQKAALYFKGHPEFEKGGTLNVKGNTKHAIASKEYTQIKKSVGTINILGAEGDGIHAGQYFQINGGTVTIRNVKGDGIQSESTNDATDELNGQMIIKGGTLDIQCDANGVLVESTTNAPALHGPGGPGGGHGGWPGGWDREDQETSCVSCLKVDSLCTISGGTLKLKATGKGGKCIKVDHDLIIGTIGADGPTITASTTGGVVSGSGENLNGQPKAIKAYGNLDINSGSVTCTTTQNGGEGIECKSYLTINGGTVVCNTYDDGLNAKTKITFNGGIVWSHATNNDGIDCNGSAGFEFNGGIVLSSGARSPEEGFDCDNYSFVINGGTIIGTGGASSNPTKATQPFKLQTGQSLTANTYLSLQKQDGTVICSYKVPTTLSNATVLVSSPEFVSGTSYRLVRNSTAVTNPTESYLDGRFTVGGTLTGGTTTNITPGTK